MPRWNQQNHPKGIFCRPTCYPPRICCHVVPQQPITPEDYHLMNTCLDDLRSTSIVEWMGFHLFMFINFLFLGRLLFWEAMNYRVLFPSKLSSGHDTKRQSILIFTL